MNIKKIVAGVLACCIVGGVMPTVKNVTSNIVMTAGAADEYAEGTYEQLTYRNYGDHIEISRCDKSVTEVIIPSEIDGVPVTLIGYESFAGCKEMTSVTIPDSITEIEAIAFDGCTSLISVTIPESVTSIGTAFSDCTNLTSVTVLNPECIIYDFNMYGENAVIANGFNEYGPYFHGTIYGYENSTIQQYAESYNYKFESLGKAPEKETVMGDIDGNNIIDANDASLVLAEFALISTGDSGTFTESIKKSADINKDGLIDSVDASLILSYYSYTSTGGTDTIDRFLESDENN